MYVRVLWAVLANGFAWADDAVKLADKPPVAAPPSWTRAVVAHWGKIGLFFAILFGYALLLTSAFLLYLLFARRRAFAPGFIIMLWVGLLWAVLLEFAMDALGLEKTDPAKFAFSIVRDLIGAVIWTAYMMKSERVRATFVRTRSPPAATTMLPVPDSSPGTSPAPSPT
jgi:hypothetical protein